MGCAKGTIHVTPAHDLPILRQVLRCGFVTHEQLWAFLSGDGSEWCRRSFNRRLVRLVAHGFLTRRAVTGLASHGVYSTTAAGIEHLAGAGEYISTAQALRRGQHPGALQHELDLNDLHLALRRTGGLLQWTYATEIRSVNELTGFGYAKDYDAVLRIRVGDVETEVALEYERTPKSHARYRALRDRLTHERRVSAVLYLVPNFHLARYVSRHLDGARLPVLCALFSAWLSAGLNAPLVDPDYLVGEPVLTALTLFRASQHSDSLRRCGPM